VAPHLVAAAASRCRKGHDGRRLGLVDIVLVKSKSISSPLAKTNRFKRERRIPGEKATTTARVSTSAAERCRSTSPHKFPCESPNQPQNYSSLSCRASENWSPSSNTSPGGSFTRLMEASRLTTFPPIPARPRSLAPSSWDQHAEKEELCGRFARLCALAKEVNMDKPTLSLLSNHQKISGSPPSSFKPEENLQMTLTRQVPVPCLQRLSVG
jgi:hypothetical protein